MTGKSWAFGKRIAVLALLLAACAQPAMAVEVVDLDGGQPLGEVVVDTALGKIYFSLGNGRAISYALGVTEERQEAVMQHALLQDYLGPQALKPPRHNIRWSK
jgi:hypothetical protein